MKTYNFRGLADDKKRQQAFQWLKQKKIGIVCGQETHSSVLNETKWREEWGGDIFFSHGSSAARGTFILFDRNIDKQIHKEIIDRDEGRYVILDITIEGIRLTLACIYAPNNDCPEFFTKIKQNVESQPNDNRIIGGDYNLVLNLQKDKKGGNPITHSKAQKIVKKWMQDTELIDVWRMQNPDELKYTWSKSKPSLICCRLDFFLVSQSLVNKIEATNISPGFRSDHSAVTLDFVPNKTPRGQGYWKLNCSHLTNPDYIKKIKEVINTTANYNKDASPNTLWDIIKTSIRGESIKFGAIEKKKLNNEVLELEKDIEKLETEAQKNPLSGEQEITLNQKKQNLINIFNQKANGAYVRSRSQGYEEGEKNSAYFFNLEKRNSEKKSIEELDIGTEKKSKIIKDQNEILNEMKGFYKKLYSAEKLNKPENFIKNLSQSPSVPLEKLEKLSDDFDEPEISTAIKNMQNNKSPGEDGLPIEFYKVFWLDIKDYLIASYKHSMAEGSLSITQKRGIISLLPKKKNLLFLKNWRPLTLLNVDYKIFAKLIATRLKTILSYIIHADQTGFMKGRFIGENIVTLLDIIDYCEKNGIEAVLISVDFEKAFDQLDWDFIWESLAYFQIPETLISWIKTLYNDSTSCVTNNGHISRYFKMGRGVRQGCPLSPYLFIIAAEVLAISMRENENIKGIQIGNKNLKLKQYADDTQSFSILDQDSINSIFNNLRLFGEVSGSKVNYDKSHIMRIGSIRNTNICLPIDYEAKWTNGPLEVLGIEVTTKLDEITNININKTIPKVEQSIAAWERRKLTLFGKTNVINTVLTSKFIYRLSSLPTPNETEFLKIEKIFLDFLWGDIKTKIAKNFIMNDRENGGLKVTDIFLKEKALKISWIKRLLENDTQSYSPYLASVTKIKLEILLQCNLKTADMQHGFSSPPPSFWVNVLSYWFEQNFTEHGKSKTPGMEIIWFNSNIRIENKVIFYKNFYENNITQVNQLYGEGTNWLTYDDLLIKFRGLKTNFLQYMSLLSAIPNSYKRKLHTTTVQDTQLNSVEKLRSIEKVPKYIYNKELKKRNHFPYTAFNKIRDRCQNLTEESYTQSFELMYKCTSSTKLKDFQFRLLHMRLNTNRDRFLFGQIDSDRCSFCDLHEENIFHLLMTCETSKEIWIFLQRFLYSKTNIHLIFSEQDLLLGSEFFPFFQVYNHLIILTKQYIYACRCKGIRPNGNVLLSKIELEYEIEKRSNFGDRHLARVKKKWEPIFENIRD